MEMIRETADAVMQLLKILLTLLMNQVQTQVEEQGEQLVPNEHALQMQHLMQEVQSQKAMLQQIASNLKMPGTKPTSPGHRDSEWSEVSEREIHLWEDELQMMNEKGQASGALSPVRVTTSQSVTSPPSGKKPSQAVPAGMSGARSRQIEAPALGGPILAPGGVWIPEEKVSGSEFTAPHGRDVAWTQDAMTSWGRKTITWGKKHPGKMYYQIYETDDQYANWCLSRINSLGMPVLDFAKYCQVRRQMEAHLHQGL